VVRRSQIGTFPAIFFGLCAILAGFRDDSQPVEFTVRLLT
jgi:hypothetical protein